MDQFERTYSNNLQALNKTDPNISRKLSEFQENKRFEASAFPNGYFDILDLQTEDYLYSQNPERLTQKTLNYFYALREHPFIYLFGIGNGKLQKELLKNPKCTLTIIEPELELLFVALHLEDFSQEIAEGRIIFLLKEHIKFAFIVQFLNQNTRVYYARSFKIHYSTTYYEKYYHNDLVEINHVFLESLEFIIVNSGNHIEDALMGLEHHIYNIPRMVTGPQFKRFITQKNSDTVIMVSTGPSLAKQLSLLKEIQNHATIICADSALRILYANDIIPDICVSIERVKEVVDLFKDIPTNYKQKVIFFRSSMEHKDVFETLKGCPDILVMRPHKYNTQFGLDPYGLICSGTSVANLAHELCAFMRFKTCIIIGQDLAFGKKGVTHCKGHCAGDYDRADTSLEKVELPAYGGKGAVISHKIWEQFLNALIQTVNTTQYLMPTINATEGGVRIDGTIEMPFKKAIKKYVSIHTLKQPIAPIQTVPKEAKKYYKLAQKNISKILKEGKILQKIFQKSFKQLSQISKKLESKSIDAQLTILSEEEVVKALTIIEETRALFEENYMLTHFYWEIMQSIVVHYELELANIKIMPVESPSDNQLKAIKWIFNHSHYFYTIAGALANTIFWIERGRRESIEELPEALKFLLEK